MLASMADVEPLPLLPATCTMRNCSCGLPSAASSANIRSSLRSLRWGVRCSKLTRPNQNRIACSYVIRISPASFRHDDPKADTGKVIPRGVEPHPHLVLLADG